MQSSYEPACSPADHAWPTVKIGYTSFGGADFARIVGDKGLHVVTWLTFDETGTVDRPALKKFALQMCIATVAEAPERFPVSMSKKL